MEHLLDFFIPTEYKISLFLDKHQKTIRGEEEIKGQITKAGLLKLHSVGLNIKNLQINDQNTKFTLENGVLTAIVPQAAATTPSKTAKTPQNSAASASNSNVVVKVGWDGSLNENMQGAYLSTYKFAGKTEKIISTQFESHYAREAFPCVDEPAAKATFELEITVPDADDIVLSNMPELNVASRRRCAGYDRAPASATPATAGGRDLRPAKATLAQGVTHCFPKTPKMSTYLLAFVVGQFNCRELKTKSGITVRTYAPLDQDPSLLEIPTEIAQKSLEYYENLFQTPYPLEKLDQVAIPDFEAGAMENWGLVTYRSSQLLCNQTSSLNAKKAVALTVTHELSHQWFGNLVTMCWWDDLWLNESFATIMEYYCTNTLFPEYQVWSDFFTQDCFAALSRDAIQGVQAVRENVADPAEIATLFDPCIVYAKGAHLMLMLIREMGETNFFKGLKSYFAKNKYKNTSASDLWRALNPEASFNVEEFMTAWLTQPGYPVITDEAQQRFLLDGTTDDTQYPVPEPKDDMSGHYLLNLSGPEFAEALDRFQELSEEQKIRLLIDRLLLSRTPLVSSSSLLPLLKRFNDETSAPIWSLLDAVLSHLTIFIDYDTPEEEKFKAFVYSLIEKPLRTLGLTPREDDNSNQTDLRNIFLANALYSKNPDFLERIAGLYNPDYSTLPAETRPVILATKLWLDEKNIYPEILKNYRTTTDPELKATLRARLAQPRLKENIVFAFDILKDQDLIKPQDHLGFLLRLRRWKYTRNHALTWLTENWDYIAKVSGEKSLEDYPRYFASTINTKKDADVFFDFFTPLSSNPVLARSLKIAKNDITSTLSLISQDKASVLKAINKL